MFHDGNLGPGKRGSLLRRETGLTVEPLELHDYRYLGDDYRERERLAKIKRNLLGKLKRLPPLERYAMLSALDEYRSGTADFGGAAG